MNRRLVRLVLIDTPPSGVSSLKVVKKYLILPNYIYGSTAQPYDSYCFHGLRNEYS